MTDIETRSFRVPFELRTDGENQTIVGYASTFDQPYPVDMVTEIIDRSAFTRTLSEKPDVYALIGHDPSRILGRTKNGTLSLSIDERGLKCVITPVMTRDAEDTLKLIASGCIDAMSFGFKVVKQAFGYADGKTTRRITDLELHEVSCVAFPANENATLSLRAKQMARECRASQGSDHWQGNYGNGIEIPPEAWQEMSGSGQKDSAVSRWVNSSKIVWSMDDEAIAKELKEHGAWSEKELSNAKENKKRILWIASNDISEEEGRSSSARLETRANKPKRFSARMNASGGQSWDITVETEGGKTVYEYQFPDKSNGADPEDEQTSLIDDGFLKHTKDYKGLADYMVHIGVMQSGDELFKEGDLTGDLKNHATGWVGRSSSARLETRQANLYFSTYSQALTEVKKTLDEQGWDIEDWSSITSSKKKPSEGETVRLSVPVTHNRYAIDGDTSEGGFDKQNMKVDYGQVEIQVYNKGNDTPKPFELNFYTNKTKKRSSSTQLETRSATVRLTVKKMSRAEPFPSSGSLVFDGKTVYQVVSDDSYLTDAKTVSVEAKRIGEPTDFSEDQMLSAYKGTLERSSSTQLETRDWGNTSSKGVVIEVLRFKMDSNGNKTVMVKTSPNGRAQAIQTNGNLPETHSMTDDVSEMGAVDLGTIADEVVKHLKLKPKNPNKELIESEGKRLDWKQNSAPMKLLELRNRIASPIDTETRGLADFALMASAGLGLFIVSKIVSGVLFFWYDCAYNTYGGGKNKVRVSAKTDKDAVAEVKKLNPEAQDIRVQKVKK